MDIVIPDNWLRDFLETDAKPAKIAECLSLCGPSINKIEKIDGDSVYFIEITTNRVDSASVYGIAREASAILPRFGIKASFNQPKSKSNNIFVDKVSYLNAVVDHKLCPRFTAALIKNVKIKPSPQTVQERLKKVGVRPINNVVDISNYIMHELGQPVHTFDYDKIRQSKMLLRASRKGEQLITLDAKTHTLPGGDIIIEDGEGRLIDLAGIMGGENSQVDANTKNVLLFVQTYNPLNIRRTSISLDQRTQAAVLFEKGLDSELVTLAIKRGIDLFAKLTEGKPEDKILDIYPNPYITKKISLSLEFIISRLGINVEKALVAKILNSLGFITSWSAKTLTVDIPSFRANDIEIEEDIVEEIARIYGYHKLPSFIMAGSIPEPAKDTPFAFETKVKNSLRGLGAVECYTYSLISKDFILYKGLKLKNPLGADSEYLRNSLRPSLTQAAWQNSGETSPYHLFEMANVYLLAQAGIPKKASLPDEKMTLAGMFANYEFRKTKGIIEAFLQELKVNFEVKQGDSSGFLANRRIVILQKSKILGELGVLEEKGYIYYEFDMETLRTYATSVSQFTPLPKYPAQIEDITLILPERTRVGEIVASITAANKLIQKVELTKIYKDSYTFRVWYQHPKKTLTGEEVNNIRDKILEDVGKKHGARQKV